MNTERIRSAGMALVVVAAVALSASTLASSMSTDPADAVDIQWDSLPLGEDSEADVVSAAQGIEDTYESGGDGDSESGSQQDSESESREDGGGAPRQRAGEEAGDSELQSEQSDGSDGRADSDQSDRSDAQSNGQQQNGKQESGGSDGVAATGWPRVLLGLLALLVVVVSLTYRYRERLRRLLGSQSEPSVKSFAPAPENDVERAWAELVRRAGIDEPRTRTPRDCARRAIETGFDPGEVDRLRRTFEDVRYGTTPVTDEQARLARETLDGLDGEPA